MGSDKNSVTDYKRLGEPNAAAALMKGLKLDWGSGLAKKAAAAQAAGLTVAVSDASTGWRYAHWLADLEWNAPDGTWQPVTADGGIDERRVVAQVFS